MSDCCPTGSCDCAPRSTESNESLVNYLVPGTWYQVPGAAVVLVPGYRYWHDVHKRVYRYIAVSDNFLG